MKIETSPNFLQIIKDKWLLLDTCVFIDTSLNSSEFAELFNALKSNNTTLLTIKPVKMEFVEGAPNKERFNEKSQIIEEIVESFLPISPDLFKEKD